MPKLPAEKVSMLHGALDRPAPDMPPLLWRRRVPVASCPVRVAPQERAVETAAGNPAGAEHAVTPEQRRHLGRVATEKGLTQVAVVFEGARRKTAVSHMKNDSLARQLARIV